MDDNLIPDLTNKVPEDSPGEELEVEEISTALTKENDDNISWVEDNGQ